MDASPASGLRPTAGSAPLKGDPDEEQPKFNLHTPSPKLNSTVLAVAARSSLRSRLYDGMCIKFQKVKSR